jgi:acyl carrier protein
MEDAIAKYVSEDLLGGDRAVTAEEEIVLDGTVDSLGVTRLVDFMEREFAVSIPPEDVTIENFRSIATMASYIRTRQE